MFSLIFLQDVNETELLSMLRFGADQICNLSEARQLTDVDIDGIIERTDARLVMTSSSSSSSSTTTIAATTSEDSSAIGTSIKYSAKDFNPELMAKESRDFQVEQNIPY